MANKNDDYRISHTKRRVCVWLGNGHFHVAISMQGVARQERDMHSRVLFAHTTTRSTSTVCFYIAVHGPPKRVREKKRNTQTTPIGTA